MSHGVLIRLPQISLKKKSAEKDVIFDFDELVIDEPVASKESKASEVNDYKAAHKCFCNFLRSQIVKLIKYDSQALAQVVQPHDDALARAVK